MSFTDSQQRSLIDGRIEEWESVVDSQQAIWVRIMKGVILLDVKGLLQSPGSSLVIASGCAVSMIRLVKGLRPVHVVRVPHDELVPRYTSRRSIRERVQQSRHYVEQGIVHVVVVVERFQGRQSTPGQLTAAQPIRTAEHPPYLLSKA